MPDEPCPRINPPKREWFMGQNKKQAFCKNSVPLAPLNRLTIIQKEPGSNAQLEREKPLKSIAKPESLKITPLANNTSHAKVEQRVKPLQSLTLKQPGFPPQEKSMRAQEKLRLPYIPKASIFDAKLEKEKMESPKRTDIQTEDIVFDHRKIPQHDEVIFLKQKLISLQNKVKHLE